MPPDYCWLSPHKVEGTWPQALSGRVEGGGFLGAWEHYWVDPGALLSFWTLSNAVDVLADPKQAQHAIFPASFSPLTNQAPILFKIAAVSQSLLFLRPFFFFPPSDLANKSKWESPKDISRTWCFSDKSCASSSFRSLDGRPLVRSSSVPAAWGERRDWQDLSSAPPADAMLGSLCLLLWRQRNTGFV